MNNIIKYALLALALFSKNTIISQNLKVNDTIISVQLDEVVVSTPFKESVRNNVLKVNKLNLKSLNYIKRQNFSSSLEEIPGISIISTGPGISKPVIRGLSSNRVTIFNQFIRLENQQWGSEHGMGISGFGVGSIEVIKGPMSVLYGSDAVGGVVYVNPDSYYNGDGIEIELATIYNSNFNGFTNNLGIKGGSNKLSYLVQTSLVNNDNFNTPDQEIENTYFNQNDLKLGLGYTTDNFISDLRFSVSNSEIGIPHFEEDHDDDHDDDHEKDEEEKSYQELTNTMISSKNRILFENNSEIEFTLGFSSNKRKEFGEHEEEGHDDHDDDDHDDHGDEAHINMDLETTTFDFKYIFAKSKKLELIVGSDMMRQTNTNLGEEELIPDADKKDFGVYALSHLHTSKWDILLGLRSDNRNINTSKIGLAQVIFDKDFSSFTSSLGFKRDFSENKIFRINFSNGYRGPNLSELFSDGVHHGTSQYEVGDSSLIEEKNFQTDISFSSFGSDSSFGIDVFYNSIQDYIYLNPTGNSINGFPLYNYNQTDASLMGGELYFSKSTSIEWLSYKTSFEYVSGEKSEGSYLPFISPLTFKHSFNLDFNNNNYKINFLAKGKQNNIGQFETATDSYLVMNLSGSHESTLLNNKLDFVWSINNLFDKEYFDHLSRFKKMGIHEMGRNISFGLNYKF
ncbi:MAG: TonB-dependent receptor [Flavobacteriales bacterium]|jgi:iron complex outermembrane receptor protein|tara:strand:- start:194 stop:2236 length:2043 start_codon:yes stop_codon:yes gene_type:complete